MKKNFLVLTFCSLVLTSVAQATSPPRLPINQEIHFWIKAFIPSSHPSLPKYIFKAENSTYVMKPEYNPIKIVTSLFPRTKVVTDEVPMTKFAMDLLNKHIVFRDLVGNCFSTDNREFSNSPDASARVTVEMKIRISDEKIRIGGSNGKNISRIGETKLVDCKSGKNLKPPKTSNSNTVKIGSVKSLNSLRTINIKASTGNPFLNTMLIEKNLLPKIDFDFSMQYDISNETLTIFGSTGVFPAFEAYYKVPGKPAVAIMKRKPKDGATAEVHLFDAASGVFTSNFKHVINLDSL